MATGGAARLCGPYLTACSLLYLTLSAASCQQQDIIDNSILASPLPPQQADMSREPTSDQTAIKQQDSSASGNSLAGSPVDAQEANQRQENSLDRLAGEGSPRLERRLDRLEFELRKSMHLMRSSLASNLSASQLLESRWLSVASRLEHMENFITITTKKLYETEQRVRQLEKCDCRQTCRWTQPSSDGSLNSTELVKLDGEVWRNKCDVCSCHRGKVRCRHTSCPKLHCPDPRNVAGQCCPVCYEPCVYKGQSVRHGNKLVINSNQDTCKECMCIDGRLKCQRVEVETANGSGASDSRGATSGPHTQRQQRSTAPRLLELDELEEEEGALKEEGEEGAGSPSSAGSAGIDAEPDGAGSRRRRRYSQARQLPLLCPQVSCSGERQFRLQNDCCTYCAGFDFCAHNLHHQCHPNAFCINVQPDALLNLSATHAPLPAAATFTCRCKAGFTGDGRLECRDVDECARRELNHCDPRTTHCLNQPGGYRCTCRPGFRPVLGDSEPGGLWMATPTSEGLPESRVRRCEDVNECADGKLNRCHPQARCTNLRGSYKCRCRRGYLGNGFECHKWFSSDPNVAAYLHRHGEPGAQADSGNSTAAVNEPLDSLSDPDDDQADDEAAPRPDDEDAEAADGESEPELEESRSSKQEDGAPSRLSESRWEPLLSDSTSIPPQQLGNANQVGLTTTANEGPTAAAAKQVADNQRNLEQNLQRSENLNTRTMFFQPPPVRYWQTSDVSTERPSPADVGDDSPTTLLIDRKSNERFNDTNDSVNSRQSSQTVYQNNPEQIALPSSQRNSPITTNGNLTLTQLTGSISMHNASSPVYKKGTIIATAAISPTRSQSSRMAHASQFQRSKVLHVTSSSNSSFRPSNLIYNFILTSANYLSKLGELFRSTIHQHFCLYMLISIIPLHFIFN